MAASTITPHLSCKRNHQPNLLLHYNNPPNKTLQRFKLSHPKPLSISSHIVSRQIRVSPETTTTVKSEEDDFDSSEAVNTKLYFGNLPYNVDNATLAHIIQDFANPELVEVLYNRDTGHSRGFAFVTMSNVGDCNVNMENLDGTEYLGRTMKVNFADKPKPNKEPLYLETEYKLFVELCTMGITGKSRGYGFECYSSKTEMETALESLDGFELEGRAFRVNLPQGKKY
ncbi:unnamed protein product [Cochlearia groenlandica]